MMSLVVGYLELVIEKEIRCLLLQMCVLGERRLKYFQPELVESLWLHGRERNKDWRVL